MTANRQARPLLLVLRGQILDQTSQMGQALAMSELNMSKVAVGCASLETLRRRQQARLVDGIVPVRTRFRPKRADELVGGSLYWIIKQRVAARQMILGFAVDAARGKTIIRLDPELVPVRPQARRGHQGWRYLAAADAPADWDGTEDGLGDLPQALAGKLEVLALI